VSARGKGGSLGDSLDSLMRRLNRKTNGAYVQTRIAGAWAEIAGPSVLSHTTGAHLRAGEMIVYVDSPVWATELSALAEEYRTRVNAHLGNEAVRSVRFTVSKRVGEQRGFEIAAREALEEDSRDKVDSIPLSAEERAQVEASTAAIEDDELREAVLRATVADLEWKKGLSEAKNREKPRQGL